MRGQRRAPVCQHVLRPPHGSAHRINPPAGRHAPPPIKSTCPHIAPRPAHQIHQHAGTSPCGPPITSPRMPALPLRGLPPIHPPARTSPRGPPITSPRIPIPTPAARPQHVHPRAHRPVARPSHLPACRHFTPRPVHHIHMPAGTFPRPPAQVPTPAQSPPPSKCPPAHPPAGTGTCSSTKSTLVPPRLRFTHPPLRTDSHLPGNPLPPGGQGR
ncbi:hypothetical protein GDO81_026404 [Engystomops pustulosus]|uniref:Uncharacterized protein n=1 Tax=Engystomops pustulosus TaxID=76066 RepID=A0AAV6YRK6_ENGPU|nr:hypothetical protein GDO81_026404 [Engystomops pustulosus]